MSLSHRYQFALVVAVSFAAVTGTLTFGEVPSLLLPESSLDDETSGFVAVGELQRIRRDDGTRRLALLNESGEIAAFLAPSARVNMRRYVGQSVAVTARNVTRAEGEAPSIIPARITPLTARRPSPSSSADVPIGSGVQQASFVEVDSSAPTDVEVIDPGYESWEVMGDYETDGIVPGSLVDGEFIDGGIVDGGIVDGGIVDGGIVDGDLVDGGLVDGSVVDSGYDGTCGGCVTHFGGCGFQCGGGCGVSNCGPWGRMFVRAEYIGWWTKGMDVPALVTTSRPGGSVNQAGVLEAADILYGRQDILDDSRSGFRIRFGGYLGLYRRFGWEMEYFGLGDEGETFEASSDGSGNPVLARPFFNINPRVAGGGALQPPPREDAELVAFPGVISGTVTVASQSSVDSAAARLRWNFCCKKIACGNRCVGCGPPQGFKRVDFTFGYRYFGLDDSIVITENLTSLQANPSRFELFDQFETDNDFNGAEVGFVWEGGWRNFTLELLSRMAIGNVRQRVAINGQTTISPLNPPQEETFQGGLLAQRTNIGTYSRDEFGVLNELGLTLGCYLTPRLRATVGYTFVYLTPVVRAGDQIDRDVNPDLLPPEIEPFTGPDRPQFAFRETDIWANGINIGLDLRW